MIITNGDGNEVGYVTSLINYNKNENSFGLAILRKLFDENSKNLIAVSGENKYEISVSEIPQKK